MEKGKLTFKEGAVYEGELVNNVPNGKGKFTFAQGSYEGDFVDGKWHGKGKFTTADGNVYECSWVNGIQNGKGKVTYAKGGYYEGDFLNGNIHGKGKVTLRSGSVYEGEWVEEDWHGKGKYTMANGVIYEGDFVDGELNKGKMTKPNGDVYEGDLVKCEPYGKGKMKYHDGRVEEGNWKEGEFLGDDNFIADRKATEENEETKKNLEFDIWYEERAKKILLICSAICFGLGLIFGVVVLTDANSLSTGIFLGIWYGTGLGGVISLFPRLFRAHKESGKELSLGLTLVLSLFFMLIGPISLLIRILRMNYRIKKFKKQLSALG